MDVVICEGNSVVGVVDEAKLMADIKKVMVPWQDSLSSEDLLRHSKAIKSSLEKPCLSPVEKSNGSK